MAKAFAHAAVILICLVLTAVIYGCSPQEQPEPLKEEFFNYTAYFCSEQDCLQAFASQLRSAKASISCALYSIDNNLLADLASFHNASANITLNIVADKNSKVAEKFVQGNSNDGFVLKRNSKGIMHNKYCVIDDFEVITGSFNPTAAAKNDYNNMLVINSTTLAAFYSQNFNMLKENPPQTQPQIKPVPKVAALNDTIVKVHFCPQDNCASAVKRELEKANSSIIFAAYSFTSSEIANELILKSREGVHVSGVIEKSTTGNTYSKDKVLAANGIPVLLESSKKLMHHKFFIVDNRTLITGSFNPTENANSRNDENIIIITNAAVSEKYSDEFYRIYGDTNVHR